VSNHSDHTIPYLSFARAHGDNIPPLVPIMVGNTSPATERSLGKVLAPYLTDPTNAFVVSSDFAHWGLRFRYTHYQPSSGAATSLRANSKAPDNPEIHESIRAVDLECMGACESGSHQNWLDVLRDTGNTVCGRHPIGVVMAGLEELRQGGSEGLFRFVRYERSGEVKKVAESSVSYASAFAVMQ
jgi:AmmeMemoRadiSam system protein B